MTLPDFTPSIGAGMRAEIMAELAGVEQRHRVRILFAIESGSRAWGFPSPDSDYDVRFVYAHPMEWYLSLLPRRDVIELPIHDDLDIGGWDIRKALTLLLKPNPVMLEWLSSPIRYLWDGDTCAKLTALAQRTAHAPACLHHYLHLGEGQWRQHVADRSEVSYKKYFYVLRPALAIRWVRLNPDTPPPMNIQAMSNGLDLSPGALDDISRLLAIKTKTRETGTGSRIARLDDMIRSEFDWAHSAPTTRARPDLAMAADDLFREIVMTGGQGNASPA